jgi:hypothetical protein
MKLLSLLTHNDGYAPSISVLFYTALICTFLWTVPHFIANYIRARRTGLEIIISPITPYTLTWRLTSSLFRPILQQFGWYRAIDWTCCWQDGNTLHSELGDSFLVVSPGLIVLCTIDATTYEAVLKGWREFEKPDNVNEILGTFGRNVDTVRPSQSKMSRQIESVLADMRLVEWR